MPGRNKLGLALCLSAVLGAGAQVKPDALILYRNGEYERARTACMTELEADSGNMEAYVVLTWSLVALGRYADAELYATRAYERIRKDPRIVETLGEAAYHQGKNDQALAH
ncbi:MAG: tetratricopeptide repeat protein, partial [Spirochaetales bacterium]